MKDYLYEFIFIKSWEEVGLKEGEGKEVEGKVELHGFSVDRFSFIS